MLLAYVDESYTDDWFAMAALLVDGPAAVALTDELDRVAAAASKAYAVIAMWSFTGMRSSTPAERGRACPLVRGSVCSMTSWRLSLRRMCA